MPQFGQKFPTQIFHLIFIILRRFKHLCLGGLEKNNFSHFSRLGAFSKTMAAGLPLSFPALYS